MKYFLVVFFITLFTASTYAYADYHDCMDAGGYHGDCKSLLAK